jgi:hypothetical protein
MRLRNRRKSQRINWSAVEWTPFQVEPDDPLSAERVLRYSNSRYIVSVRFCLSALGDVCWLSIKTHDRAPRHDWRDMQRIKDEIVGPDFDAIEIYPKAAHLVDTSNQYHLWVLMEREIGVGFRERLVSERPGLTGAKQRPFPADRRPTDLLTGEELKSKAMAHTAAVQEGLC